MPEHRLEEMVRNAVAQALDRHLSSLRENVVQEVLRELGPALGGKVPAANASAILQKAVSAIQAGGTQKEILRNLLDNMILYSGRAALFVVKNGAATGWQSAGFSNNEWIKDFPLDLSAPLPERVMRSRSCETGAAAEFDSSFTSKFGAPVGQVALLPLMLKEKISALVYADAGPEGGTMDPAALDVLVRAASSSLEVIAQRRQRPEATDSMPGAAAGGNDPFAAHAPIHSAKAQQLAEAAPAAAMSAAAAWGGTTSTASADDAEMHRKAQRFARLLMDEIKLYNQAKVAEGRKHKDLYDRLKDDIEKSRATYLKRYGNSLPGSADYFTQELIRSLAEDDVSLLGKNFRR